MTQLRYELRDFNELQRRFDAKTVDKALRFAITGTRRKVATFISRDIREVYAIKAGDIKRQLSIRTFNSGTSQALLYTGGPISLSKFKPKTRRVTTRVKSKSGARYKAKRRAATVRIRKDRGRKIVSGGFLRGDEVYRRSDQEQSERFPIRRLTGPSIPGMVSYPSTITGAENLVGRDLPQQFSDRLEFLLSKD